jgi:hypothetical protein
MALLSFKRVLVCGVVALVTLAGTSVSFAQPGGGRGGAGARMMGGMNPRAWSSTEFSITQAHVETFAKILALTPEQLEAAKALRQGQVDLLQPKIEEMTKAREDARETFRETRDPSVWQALGERQLEVVSAREKGEKVFMDDFKSLLTTEQQAKMPRAERYLRRETTLSTQMMPFGVPGDKVDLSRLVRALGPTVLDDATNAKIDPVLDRYETEFDTALVKRNAIMDEGMNNFQKIMADFQAGNTKDIEKAMGDMKDLMTRMRDINRRYLKEIVVALPPESGASLEKNFRQAAYPEVYGRAQWSERAFVAALALPDLTESQRTSIQQLQASVQRDSAALNEKLEKAVDEQSAASFDFGRLMGGGVNPFMGNEAMNTLRTQRRDLEDKADKQLTAIVGEELRKSLPARNALGTRGGDQAMPGGGGNQGGRGNRGNQPGQPRPNN